MDVLRNGWNNDIDIITDRYGCHGNEYLWMSSGMAGIMI